MPTKTGRPYATSWLGSPPHMLHEDIPIWHKFLRKYGDFYPNIYYDVAVGGPFLSPEELKDPLKKMWQYNNSKRIDALIKLPNEVMIIEVTAQPGLRSIGQLLTYVALWQEDDPWGLIERPYLVCEAMDTDLLSAAAKFGITTFIVL